jgi:hypothetical protein
LKNFRNPYSKPTLRVKHFVSALICRMLDVIESAMQIDSEFYSSAQLPMDAIPELARLALTCCPIAGSSKVWQRPQAGI